MLEIYGAALEEHRLAFEDLGSLEKAVLGVGELLKECIRGGNKVLVCGNGGSAADAQHFAAELTGRFEKERRAYAAVALTTDTSALTAIGNDYGYDAVFSRQVEALGEVGDILIAISTSGTSSNIIAAAKAAKRQGLKVIGLLGRDGGLLKDYVDLDLTIPATRTARIQECHIFLLHVLCEILDETE